MTNKGKCSSNIGVSDPKDSHAYSLEPGTEVAVVVLDPTTNRTAATGFLLTNRLVEESQIAIRVVKPAKYKHTVLGGGDFARLGRGAGPQRPTRTILAFDLSSRRWKALQSHRPSLAVDGRKVRVGCSTACTLTPHCTHK